jgi:hypothetical protein
MRAVFPVPLCVTLGRCRPLCCGVHGHIADGRPGHQRGRCTPSASADSHGRTAPAAGSGLTRAAAPSVHPGVPAQWPGGDYRGLRGPPDATSRWPRDQKSKCDADLINANKALLSGSFVSKLATLYEDTLSAAPNAQVYVMGYPYLFPQNASVSCAAEGPAFQYGPKLVKDANILVYNPGLR